MLTLTLKTDETQILTFSKITALKTALAEAKRKATTYPYIKLAYVIADEQGEIAIGTKGPNWHHDSYIPLRQTEKKVIAYSERSLFHNQVVYQNGIITATTRFFELQNMDLSKFNTLPWKGTQERTEQVLRNLLAGAEGKVRASYKDKRADNNGHYDYITLETESSKVKMDARLLKYFLNKYKDVALEISKDANLEPIYIYSQGVLVAVAMPLNIK